MVSKLTFLGRTAKKFPCKRGGWLATEQISTSYSDDNNRGVGNAREEAVESPSDMRNCLPNPNIVRGVLPRETEDPGAVRFEAQRRPRPLDQVSQACALSAGRARTLIASEDPENRRALQERQRAHVFFQLEQVKRVARKPVAESDDIS